MSNASPQQRVDDLVLELEKTFRGLPYMQGRSAARKLLVDFGKECQKDSSKVLEKSPSGGQHRTSGQ